jgi:hypothetical protein
VDELGALKAVLAAEQAIVYGYGVAGAHLRGAARSYATKRLLLHTSRRDQVGELVKAAGGRPAASRAAYQLPFTVDDAATATQLAAHLELGAAGAYWDLVAAARARSPGRALAIGWLSDSAVAANRWGASQALPGQPA